MEEWVSSWSRGLPSCAGEEADDRAAVPGGGEQGTVGRDGQEGEGLVGVVGSDLGEGDRGQIGLGGVPEQDAGGEAGTVAGAVAAS